MMQKNGHVAKLRFAVSWYHMHTVIDLTINAQNCVYK